MFYVSTDIIVGSSNLGDTYDFETSQQVLDWIALNIDLSANSIQKNRFAITFQSSFYSNSCASILCPNETEADFIYQNLITAKNDLQK